MCHQRSVPYFRLVVCRHCVGEGLSAYALWCAGKSKQGGCTISIYAGWGLRVFVACLRHTYLVAMIEVDIALVACCPPPRQTNYPWLRPWP
jgi:hypothetical protein